VLTGFLPCSVVDDCAETIQVNHLPQDQQDDCGNCAALCVCSGTSIIVENAFRFTIAASGIFAGAFSQAIPSYLPHTYFPPLVQPPRRGLFFAA